MEGSGKLFSCEVDGKPEPSVECVGSEGASEGVALPLASSNPGPRNPSIPSDLAPGIYLCNATNRHGSMIKTVVVSAECERGPGGGEVRGTPGSWPLPDAPHSWLLCSAASDGRVQLPKSPDVAGRG